MQGSPLPEDRSRTSTPPAEMSLHASRISDSTAKHGAAPQLDYSKWTKRWYPWSPNVTPFERIVSHAYPGKGTQEVPFLVSWLPNDDAENPLTFSKLQKWSLTMFVSVATLAVSLASSAYSGATESIAAELGGSNTVITLGVSFFVLGFALGPLIWAPFSEMLGRRNLFLFTYAFLTLWNGVAAASQTLAQLLIFRFLAGAFGSSPLTNAGGTLADVFNSKDRGIAMSLFALAPFLGPALGPITGGFLGEAAGFRWVQGFLAIFAGVVCVVGFFMYTETYSPLLLRQRAEKLSKATGKHYRSNLESGAKKSYAQLFKTSLGRPWLLLFYEPIVLLLSLYTAVVYAILYSFFSAFPIVFQQVRGWSPGIGGLAFLGILVGMVIAIIVVILSFNPDYVRQVDKHGGVTCPPEYRLKPAILGAPLLVVGLAAFAATDFPSIHWIVPIILSAPFGFAMVLVFLSLQTYLVDAYLLYAASVLAANSVIRSLLGAVFPIITPYMYHPGGDSGNCPVESCGIHVGPAIAGALALIFMPAPFLFYRYGGAIRKKCKFASEADQLLQRMLQGSQNQQPESSPSEKATAKQEKVGTKNDQTSTNVDENEKSDRPDSASKDNESGFADLEAQHSRHQFHPHL